MIGDRLDNGLKEFPHSYELMNNLMYALFVSGDDTGNIPDWQLNQEKYKQEIIDLGERIINGCTDDKAYPKWLYRR